MTVQTIAIEIFLMMNTSFVFSTDAI